MLRFQFGEASWGLGLSELEDGSKQTELSVQDKDSNITVWIPFDKEATKTLVNALIETLDEDTVSEMFGSGASEEPVEGKAVEADEAQ